MRRLVVNLAALALAVLGSQVAHAAVYRIVAPDADERAHLLAETGHAYLRLGPLGLALATVLVLLAMVSEVRSGSSGERRERPRLWMFAIVAPAVFACQEVFERLFHDGTFPWGAPLERTFLLGLALQLPFAVAAYGVARALLGAAHAAGRILATPCVPALRVSAFVPVPVPFRLPPVADSRPGGGSRAPPAPA